MAVSRTLTTKRGHELLIDCVLPLPKKYMNRGSVTLTRCIRKTIEGMDIHQFMPSNYIIVTSNSLDSTQRQSPISLGNKFSVELLSGTEISVDKEGDTYIVPWTVPLLGSEDLQEWDPLCTAIL